MLVYWRRAYAHLDSVSPSTLKNLPSEAEVKSDCIMLKKVKEEAVLNSARAEFEEKNSDTHV